MIVKANVEKKTKTMNGNSNGHANGYANGNANDEWEWAWNCQWKEDFVDFSSLDKTISLINCTAERAGSYFLER